MLPGKKLLIVAAHMDDEVLGCGGLLARCAEEKILATVLVCAYPSVSYTSKAVPAHAYSAWKAATESCCEELGARAVFLPHTDFYLRDESLWRHEEELRHLIEEQIAADNYDWLIGHDGRDYHQDHRLLHSIMRAVLRPFATKIRHYWLMDVPGSSAPESIPEIYIKLEERHIARRERAYDCYANLVGREPPHPRSIASWRARTIYRGSQCGAPYAETFSLGHTVFDVEAPVTEVIA